jgi:hypothetical protein
MSLATHSPLLPDAIMRASTESEQNLSVSCLNCLPLAFTENCQIQDSGSGQGLFVNAENVLITGGIFVSLSCVLYKQLITIHILSARTTSYLPIPEKGTLYFKNQSPVHCLLDVKIYLTGCERFLLIVLTVN